MENLRGWLGIIIGSWIGGASVGPTKLIETCQGWDESDPGGITVPQ
ncbi:MAG: hypothetical protein FWD57_12475 [Polyangiaceae bacterium]|nr:hypothetical protein [Polyangiaceae bacterium]